MKLVIIPFLALAACSISGCAKWDSTGISYTEGSSGRAILYSSEYSAAVGRDNAFCVEGAKTASAATYNAALDVIKEVKGGISSGETIVVLNPANPQTTYASNAYFSICQLAINSYVDQDGESSSKSLSGEQVIEMFVKASDTAVKIANTQSNTQSVTSPELVDFVKAILAQNDVVMSEDEIVAEFEELSEAASE